MNKLPNWVENILEVAGFNLMPPFELVGINNYRFELEPLYLMDEAFEATDSDGKVNREKAVNLFVDNFLDINDCAKIINTLIVDAPEYEVDVDGDEEPYAKWNTGWKVFITFDFSSCYDSLVETFGEDDID